MGGDDSTAVPICPLRQRRGVILCPILVQLTAQGGGVGGVPLPRNEGGTEGLGTEFLLALL
jgi:hypothetical protein